MYLHLFSPVGSLLELALSSYRFLNEIVYNNNTSNLLRHTLTTRTVCVTQRHVTLQSKHEVHLHLSSPMGSLFELAPSSYGFLFEIVHTINIFNLYSNTSPDSHTYNTLNWVDKRLSNTRLRSLLVSFSPRNAFRYTHTLDFLNYIKLSPITCTQCMSHCILNLQRINLVFCCRTLWKKIINCTEQVLLSFVKSIALEIIGLSGDQSKVSIKATFFHSVVSKHLPFRLYLSYQFLCVEIWMMSDRPASERMIEDEDLPDYCSDTDTNSKLNEISSNFTNLKFGTRAESQQSILSGTDITYTEHKGETQLFNRSTKRLLNTSAEGNPTPSKKSKSFLSMLPTAAEIVTMEDGHVIDIVPDVDERDIFSKEEFTAIKNSFEKALFSDDDFAKIHFDYSGNHRGRYRLVCRDTFTKDWALATVPKLEDLWQGARLKPIISGPPPQLKRASVTLDVPTMEPENLFKIISTQNPNINTDAWRVFNRGRTMRGKQTWAIGIDDKSIEELKKVNFRPYCGMNRLRIVVQQQSA